MKSNAYEIATDLKSNTISGILSLRTIYFRYIFLAMFSNGEN